jgi:hypothetical protein
LISLLPCSISFDNLEDLERQAFLYMPLLLNKKVNNTLRAIFLGFTRVPSHPRAFACAVSIA